MTTEEKVALVKDAHETHGLDSVLSVLDLPKSTWYYHRNQKVSYQQKYAHVHPLLEDVAQKHPDYGYRRTTKELRETYDRVINHKVIERLHQLWDLALLRRTRVPRPNGIRQIILSAGNQVNLVAQLNSIDLFQVSYTDFTELRYADGAKRAYLIPLIGHACKMAYGWSVGESRDTSLALGAWKQTKKTFQQYGIPYSGMIVHQDRDPVFTGYGWTGQLLAADGVRLSYALGGAKDNPEMESFFSRFKAEGHSLFLDAQNIDELRTVVGSRMFYYNTERRHSSIGYMSPLEYIRRK
jgi:putative transposase|tara:strand:- start:87 stop:974 length:888 start_codon:yes stop_codon:yes gene_type:complete